MGYSFCETFFEEWHTVAQDRVSDRVGRLMAQYLTNLSRVILKLTDMNRLLLRDIAVVVSLAI